MKTLLKYPGAKNRIAPWIIKHIPEHKVYCEPFLGSGAVFLNKEPAYNEILNDLDDDIYNFFKIVRKQSEEFSRLIDATPPTCQTACITKLHTTEIRTSAILTHIKSGRTFALRCSSKI